MSSRRRFIQYVGISLASLIMGRCIPTTTCYAPALPPTVPSGGSSARDRLRDAWLKFSWLAGETQSSAVNGELGEEKRDQLVKDHREALDELVAQGELEPAVADQVQAAFEAAAYHVWRSNTTITCYEPAMIDFKITSSAELVMQAEVLEQMAQDSELDQTTVDVVKTAIERDMAFLAMSQADVQAFYDRILSSTGEGSVPSFDEVEIDRSPESIQAAQFLYDLLIGEKSQ